jgi:hypothetical protein
MKIISENNRLLRLWYSFNGRSKNKREFEKNEFIQWYETRVAHGCFYCGLSQEESRGLALKLPSERFPKSHKLMRGRSRAYYLEVDRKNPKGVYSVNNCVLACYFCNNDKSDVFNHEQYMRFLHGENWKNIGIDNKKNNVRYAFLVELLKS